MLRRVFDQAAEESITDEEVERILAPIRRMIMEGKFKKRRRFLPPLPVRVLIVVTAVLLILLPPLTASAWRDSVVEIPDAPVPLAGSPLLEGNSLSGRVTLEGTGAGGIWLALVESESMEPAGKTVTDQDGSWSFAGIPDGSYRLTVIPPPGMEAEDGTEAGEWILIDGSAELSLSGNGEREGVEVRICKAGS